MFRKSLEDMIYDTGEKLIIDLRRKEDYQKDTYPGAINIYYDDFYRYLNILPKNRRMYLFCYTGNSADEIAEDLTAKGYEVYSIEEGYRAILRWKVHNILEESKMGNKR